MRFEREGAELPLVAADVERTRLPLEQATQLPRAAFTDPAVLAWEQDALFRGGWVCAGHADQVRERGDFLMVEIGAGSVFVVADDDGIPRAFHNVCRHRGARLIEQPEGRMRRLQCPYHAWTTASTARFAPRRSRTACWTSTPPATAWSRSGWRSSRGWSSSTSPARRPPPTSTSATSPG